MVKKNYQSEILLELAFQSTKDLKEKAILEECIPFYLKKLNCCFAAVLKKENQTYSDAKVIPFIAKKFPIWQDIKSYFATNLPDESAPCSSLELESTYYYAYPLKNYGLLIFGRKKPFEESFVYELKPIIQLLAKSLVQAITIKQQLKAEKSVRESEKSLRVLSNSTAAAIIIYKNDTIIYANNAAEKITNYSQDELLKLPITAIIHPDFSYLINSTSDNSSKKSKSRLELKIIKKNGKSTWVDIQTQQIKWLGADATIISSFDISIRKNAEKKLIRAKEEAEKNEQLKSSFLANMSHEIRTPMNGILGFADLLKTPNLTPEKQLQYVKIIEKSGERMLNLINDIIDISKIEANLMKTKFSKININEQLDYIHSFFMPEATAKGLILTVEKGLHSNDCFLFTDKEKFGAILLNLVKNAIKYTDEGSVNVGYQLIENDTEPKIHFYIKDTGIGIPKDRLDAIFERFIQADLNDRMARQGAGLGLSICKAYIEMMNGTINVSSTLNTGSTFSFYLPFNSIENNINLNLLETIDTSKIQKLKLKALIVEDDDISKLLIKNYISPYCYEILEASNGKEAIDLCLTNNAIDFILMDVKMPIMSGLDATKEIRKFNKKVLIIAQTAYSLVGDKEKILEAGCNDYISKPIIQNQLDELLLKYFKPFMHQEL